MSKIVTLRTSLTDIGESTLTDKFDEKVDSFIELIKTYATGFGQVMKGIRPPGDEDIPIPCMMVGPKSVEPRMITTAKYDTRWVIDSIFYVGNNSPEAATRAASSGISILRKLFSNNALNDVGSATATSKFRQYVNSDGDVVWSDSEIVASEVSPLFKFWGANGPKYVCVGHFTLKVQTFELVQYQ